MSTFSWLDFSEKERKKALDVLDLFKQEDTRDELGIGSVRDAYADLLFPGTSTLMTRARYFLLVPWIYMQLERKRTRSTEIAATARRDEIRLMKALESSEDSDGTIGVVAREKLKRLPSSVYWQGLGVLGIRLIDGSQNDYHRSLDGIYAARGAEIVDEDKDVVGRPVQTWHSAIPKPPDGFPQQASLALRAEEAEYLRERVLTRFPRSLLAFLLTRTTPTEAADSADYFWEHPRTATAPRHNVEEIHHARCFAEVMHGAQLLYNLMLAVRAERPELVEDYRERMASWVQDVAAREAELRQWSVARFWEIARAVHPVPQRTRDFVESWLRLALPDGYKTVAENKVALQLIRARELALKGPKKARLEDRGALGRWSGQAGAGRLDYRWRPAQIMVRDIVSALEVSHA